MTGQPETITFKEGNVIISDKRVILGSRIYKIESIDSVNLTKKFPILSVILFCFGVYVLLIGVSDIKDYFLVFVAGLVTVGLSFHFYRTALTTYILQIRIAAIEIKILESKDKASIKRVFDAMQDVIVRDRNL